MIAPIHIPIDGFPDALRPDQFVRIGQAMGVAQIRRDAYNRLRGDQGSMAIWVRPSNNPADGQNHIYFGLLPINANPASYVVIAKLAAFDLLALFVDVGLGPAGGAFGPSTGLLANAWHLLVGTWSAGGYNIYLDGAFLANGGGLSGDRTLPAGAQVGFGLVPVDVSAEIGNAMFWERLLRPEEIAQMWTDKVGF